MMPGHFKQFDQQRLTLIYFVLSGLDSLSSIDTALKENHQLEIIDYIYNHLLAEDGGFYLSTTFNDMLEDSHITATYSAILSLIILNEDLQGLKRMRILYELKKFQDPNTGSVSCTPGGESDMRFMFCLFSIYYILQGDQIPNLKSVNIEKAVEFIKSCQTYEGGFAQLPGLEAHGGSTLCAVSCLKMAGVDIPKKNRLINFLVSKQTARLGFEQENQHLESCGFRGRTNKIADTCYTYWVGSTLRLLNASDLIDKSSLENFLYDCQHKHPGGFSKHRDGCLPDPLHSSLSLQGGGNFDGIFSNQVQATVGNFSVSEYTNSKISRLKFDENEPIYQPPRIIPDSPTKIKQKSKGMLKPMIKSLLPRHMQNGRSILVSIAIVILAYTINTAINNVNRKNMN